MHVHFVRGCGAQSACILHHALASLRATLGKDNDDHALTKRSVWATCPKGRFQLRGTRGVVSCVSFTSHHHAPQCIVPYLTPEFRTKVLGGRCTAAPTDVAAEAAYTISKDIASLAPTGTQMRCSTATPHCKPSVPRRGPVAISLLPLSLSLSLPLYPPRVNWTSSATVSLAYAASHQYPYCTRHGM